MKFKRLSLQGKSLIDILFIFTFGRKEICLTISCGGLRPIVYADSEFKRVLSSKHNQCHYTLAGSFQLIKIAIMFIYRAGTM